MGRESPQDIEDSPSSPDPPAALWRRLLDHLFVTYALLRGGMLCIRCFGLASGPGGTSETNSSAPLGVLDIRGTLYGGLERFNDERT